MNRNGLANIVAAAILAVAWVYTGGRGGGSSDAAPADMTPREIQLTCDCRRDDSGACEKLGADPEDPLKGSDASF